MAKGKTILGRAQVAVDGVEKLLAVRDTTRQTQFQMAPTPVEDTWSDLREVAGIKFPFHTAISSNGQPFADVTVTDYKVNSGLKAEDLQKRP